MPLYSGALLNPWKTISFVDLGNHPESPAAPIFSSKPDVWTHVCSMIGEQHQHQARHLPPFTLTQLPMLGQYQELVRVGAGTWSMWAWQTRRRSPWTCWWWGACGWTAGEGGGPDGIDFILGKFWQSDMTTGALSRRSLQTSSNSTTLKRRTSYKWTSQKIRHCLLQ